MRKSNLAKYENQKKKQENMKKGIALLIAIVMILGTVGFVFTMNPTGQIGSAGTTVEEYGLTFEVTTVEDIQLWKTQINGVEEYFYLLPSQLGYFNINQTLLDEVRSQQLLILGLNTSDANISYLSTAANQISTTLDKLNIQMGVASTVENNEFNMTYLDCQNATLPSLVFTLSESDVGLIKQHGCYEITGYSGQELLLVTEYIRYELLGANLTGQ